jgi:hypothetical protein
MIFVRIYNLPQEMTSAEFGNDLNSRMIIHKSFTLNSGCAVVYFDNESDKDLFCQHFTVIRGGILSYKS